MRSNRLARACGGRHPRAGPSLHAFRSVCRVIRVKNRASDFDVFRAAASRGGRVADRVRRWSTALGRDLVCVEPKRSRVRRHRRSVERNELAVLHVLRCMLVDRTSVAHPRTGQGSGETCAAREQNVARRLTPEYRQRRPTQQLINDLARRGRARAAAVRSVDRSGTYRSTRLKSARLLQEPEAGGPVHGRISPDAATPARPAPRWRTGAP